MPLHTKFFILIVSILIVLCPMVQSADPVTDFSRNFPSVKKGKFTSNSSTIKLPENPEVYSRLIEQVFVDLPKWKVYYTAEDQVRQLGKLVKRSSYSEHLWNSPGRISVYTDKNHNADGGFPAMIKPLNAEERKTAALSYYSPIIDTRIIWNGCKTLPEILAISKVSVRDGSLNKIPTTIVTAESEWGTQTLWLDPKRRYLPLRVVIEKTATSLIDDEKAFGKLKNYSEPEPRSTAVHGVQTIDMTRIETIAGRPMITAATTRRETTFGNGSQEVWIDKVALSNIQFVDKWEKDPFVITAKIPDGTRVTVVDDKPIEYEWRGGKIVKKIDTETLESAAAQEFIPPPGESQKWYWFAAGTLLVVGVALYFLRRVLRTEPA